MTGLISQSGPTLYLHFLVRHIRQVGSVRSLGRVLGVDVQILQQNCLRESWPEENLISNFKLEENIDAYLLCILEHRSPWVQAPILKKKEQLTLSFSVPNILAKYSAIFESETEFDTH